MTEEEIRPQVMLDEFFRLIREDVSDIFNNCKILTIPCPACGQDDICMKYEKEGFGISECNSCLTLFVNPRPKFEYFKKYYSDSKSSRYWATTFYKTTEKARREKIWKPKAKIVHNMMSQYQISQVYDIGGGYGVFAEELEALGNAKVTVIEPSVHLASVCRDKGLEVIEAFFEELTLNGFAGIQAKCFVSFELFEHLYDPKGFLDKLYELMLPGDIFIFSTLSSLGVDIQTLGKDSKAISPPQHLNFLNPESVRILLERVGLKLESVTTPGKLDLDIMKNNSGSIKEDFWRNFLKVASSEQVETMQKAISESGFSSHMLTVCKK